MKQRALAGILLAITLLTGCDSNEPDPAADKLRQDIAAGSALFEANCASCHPRSGRGDYLQKIPATLLTRRSEQELIDWIRGSDKHREMPAFTDFNEDEVKNLAAYLHSQIQAR